jgi:hypothetical protein
LLTVISNMATSSIRAARAYFPNSAHRPQQHRFADFGWSWARASYDFECRFSIRSPWANVPLALQGFGSAARVEPQSWQTIRLKCDRLYMRPGQWVRMRAPQTTEPTSGSGEIRAATAGASVSKHDDFGGGARAGAAALRTVRLALTMFFGNFAHADWRPSAKMEHG